jgi:uncharacterized protein (TIGR02266 family)
VVVDNKRQHDRYLISLEVTFESGGAKVVAHSRDISLGGMFIVTDRALPYGTAVVIEVKLPSLPAPAQISSTVRWSSGDGMGVQFGTLRAKETWAINQLARG